MNIPECEALNKMVLLLTSVNDETQKIGQNKPINEILRPSFIPFLNSISLVSNFLGGVLFPVATFTHFFPAMV